MPLIRQRSLPGSSRQVSAPDATQTVSSAGTPGSQGISTPGMPEGVPLPSFNFFTPEDLSKFQHFSPGQVSEMVKIMTVGIQAAFAKFSLYVQAKVFQNYDVQLVTMVANQAQRLDVNGDRIGNKRRALLFVNPNLQNIMWIGPGSGIGLAQGIPVPAGSGTYEVSIEGSHNQHWGIIDAAQVVPVITYW